MRKQLLALVGLLGLSVSTSAANVNLIRNAGFEAVPGGGVGQQGVMPSDWVISNVTPDTYSNDGSYGLLPAAGGNFTGVTAYEGVRFVAGWSEAGQERFGQTLTNKLSMGAQYTMSGYLHQALRADLNHPGGLEIYVTDLSSADPLTGEYLGFLGQTSSTSEGWLEYSFSFTATAAMADLSFLMFAPTGPNAYPGLDNVSLTASVVPIPAAAWLFGSALLALGGIKRTRA